MKQSLIFIIHWNLSAYTNYFLEILLILNQSYEITLIDCAVDPINNRFKDDEHYYSKYINFCYYSSVDQLFSEITEKNLNSPIIISNSIRNNLTPGFELAQKLNCPHILFEHFSSLVDPSAKISEELALRLKQLKRVIIPSEALRSFFTKTIPEALVLKYHLLPSSDYFLPITNHTRKRQLLYVGRVIEEKKIIDFIEINNTFLAKHKIELLVVGAGKLSDELSELEKKYSFLKVLNQLSPTKVRVLMDEAMAIISPSPFESYSMLTVESLLRGTPVISQNTGIASELFDKIPGLYKIDANLTLEEKVLENIIAFNDSLKTSILMKGLLKTQELKILKMLDEV